MRRWFYTALLAELEAKTLGADSALARIDEALVLARQGRKSLRSRLPASSARRNPAQARSGQSRARGGSLPDRHRHREGAGRAKLGSARGAVARQALPIDRPPRRSPRRPRARARRLFADAGNAGDRRGAGAARGAGGDRRGQGRGGAAAANDAVARRLWQRAHRDARLWRAGNNGGFRSSPRVAARRQRCAGAAWRPTTACGSAATCGASCRLCGRTRRLSSRDVEARPDSPEAGVAHRVLGTTHWFAGEYVEAREHLERALALLSPRGTTISPFGSDKTPASRQCFTLRSHCGRWATSNARFPSLTRAQARIAGLPHVQTRAYGKSQGDVRIDARRPLARRGERRRTRTTAREHDLPLWRAFGVFLQGLARAESGAPGADSRTCVAASNCCASRTSCCSTGC